MPPKTLADLERDPKNVRYVDLVAVLRNSGCAVREGKGGHTVADCGRTITIPRHRAVVLPVYVRLAVKALKGA